MSAPPASAAFATDRPATPVAVVTIDADGRILEFSPEAERLLGHSRSDVLGAQMASVIIPPRLRAPHCTGFDRYLQTGIGPVLEHAFELPALHADGSEIMVELVVTRARIGDAEVFTGTLRELVNPQSIPGELALSESFHRTIVDSSPIAITVLEPDGSWRWSSAAGLRLHGALDALGDPAALDDFLPADDRAALRRLIGRAMAGDPDREPVDLHLRGLDGAWHALTVSAENLLDEPAVHGVVLYGTDTTRLHAAEQRVLVESARLSTLIASLGVGILLQDAGQRVVLANSAFTGMFRIARPPEELIGQLTTDLARLRGEQFSNEEDMRARVQELIAGGVAAVGEEVTFADGTVVERDYAPVHLDGETHGHLWVFRDVTEQSLIRRGLEDQNRALAELATLKTEFIATASHELRTPLTSILTFAHLLAEEPDSGTEARSNALGAISRNADRMLRLVDDLILLVTLEAGTAPLRLTPVDVSALVKTAIETWGPAGTKAGVTFVDDLGPGPRLSGDPRHLAQLVDTLMASALASTPRNGRIEVHTHFDDPLWTVRLECSGLNSTTAGGDHLFTTFERGADPSAMHSNALAILLSRAVVARHGGQMSSPHTAKGATFVVRLPLTPPDDPSSD